MAHFAEIDENNMVLQVIVVDNSDILDENGQESETVGIAFCKSLFGEDTNWLQTSYNNNFRRYFAGIGSKYDARLDVFYNPVPITIFHKLNEETLEWYIEDPIVQKLFEEEGFLGIPNVPKPEVPQGYKVVWDRKNKEWDLTIDRSLY
jgi:hypothetical protein